MPLTPEAEERGFRYIRCDRCGSGGYTDCDVPDCGCYDEPEEQEPSEPCACGKMEWDDPFGCPRCTECGTGPLTEGKTLRRAHTARKHYPRKWMWMGLVSEEVRPGDRYVRYARHDYHPDGPWAGWTIWRKRISKGWGWADQHTVEPKPEGWDEQREWDEGHPLGDER